MYRLVNLVAQEACPLWSYLPYRLHFYRNGPMTCSSLFVIHRRSIHGQKHQRYSVQLVPK